MHLNTNLFAILWGRSDFVWGCSAAQAPPLATPLFRVQVMVCIGVIALFCAVMFGFSDDAFIGHRWFLRFSFDSSIEYHWFAPNTLLLHQICVKVFATRMP